MTTVTRTSDSEVVTRLVDMDRKLNMLLELPTKVNGIEESIQLLSDRFDVIQQRQDRQEKELKDLRRKVENIEKSGATKELEQLQTDIEALEWRSRSLNIEIHGIAETKGEDLLEKVNDLAKELELKVVTGEDVVALHRLPSKPGKTPGIIMRCARHELKNAFMAKRKALNGPNDKRYICENMTSRSRKLLTFAKEWAKGSGYQFVWHTGGKILVRRAPGETAAVIKCEDDLKALHL
ncbi:hypothetical protein HPB49_023709 [Dermacentor silvarum]|uniref:Uncharacterized protein n=1 Tax=Dermacentor silvarum TaxID=543639 RepID=A0ACB8D0V6_DERSI|nr:hypothetical protein HPB49_023709 [Dermacentor silvarum]